MVVSLHGPFYWGARIFSKGYVIIYMWIQMFRNRSTTIIHVCVWQICTTNLKPKLKIKGIITNSNMTWFFPPIKSTDTNSALLADIKPSFPIQAVVTNRCSENQFSCLFSGPLGWSWVIIRIEIKMKSGALLPSNLPRVIDQSNWSPRRFAARW